MSRDGHCTSTKFQCDEPLLTLEDCVECAKHWRQNYAEMGVFLWYADAYSPNGDRHANIIEGRDHR